MAKTSPETAFAEALDRIEFCLKKKRIALDLNEMDLLTLPPEIGQLTALTTLDLNNNELTTLPPEIGQLTALTTLDLGANELTTLPPEIGQLTALTTLHLARNQLTALPQEVGQLTALRTLDLSDNQLTTLPPEIGQLTALTTLVLFRNQFTTLPSVIGHLTALTTLDLLGNQITTLPPEIGQLTALTTLRLDSNQLTTLPPETGQLSAVMSLGLPGNQLTALPPQIGQLTALTELDLNSNHLTALPPEIGQLTALKSLDLRSNELTTLPPEIGQLMALTELDLNSNHLTALPPEIGQLTALTKLRFFENRLTALPPQIGQLTALTYLEPSGNHLTALPPEIGQLTALKSLDVGGNQLTTLPPQIGQLTALTELYLHLNQLTALPPQIGQLTALTLLFLHENPGLELPVEVMGPSWQAVMGGNAKPKPPSEILDYYFTHRKAAEAVGTEPLMEAKVLILGEASVGKSCLIAALSEGKKRHELDGKGTSGIVRKLWNVKVKDGALAKPRARGSETLRLNCWDFGGQEIYHSAHTLFLTRRAIYLIVISKRDNERQNNADYWLRMASSFGGTDAVIYVVVNKDDELVGHPPDEQALRRKFPQIRPFLRTSCDTLAGVSVAREAIVRDALQLDGVRLPVAKTWLAIKKKLEAMTEHTLSLQQWAALCGQDVASEDARREVLHMCDRLGTVRYFPTNLPDGKKSDAPELCETTILNPEWVTLGIYALFDDEALLNRGGLLDRNEMAGILKKRGYPVEQERIIEEVMRRFDLLYDSSDHGASHRMLIPLMLPEQEPEIDWPAGGTLEFAYQYQVMPAGLVPAFIARSHEDISPTVPTWRRGCVLELKKCQVRIISDPELKRISVSVAGAEFPRRDVLDQVRFTFDALHGAVDNLPVMQLIPVPGHPNAPMLNYEFVRSLEWNQTATFPTQGTSMGETITVHVREALDGVRGAAREARDAAQRPIFHIHRGATYIDQSTTVGRDVIASQLAQEMKNSTNRPTQGRTDGEEG